MGWLTGVPLQSCARLCADVVCASQPALVLCRSGSTYTRYYFATTSAAPGCCERLVRYLKAFLPPLLPDAGARGKRQ